MSRDNAPKFYRKKPVVIEAIQWNGESKDAVFKFIGNDPSLALFYDNDGQYGMLRMSTLEGIALASIGDYIIKGVKGEFYPCKPDIFEMTYDVWGDE